MSEHPNPHGHSVRRIVLPSGRSIEVVRLDDQTERSQHPLHVCPACDSELVQPRAWAETEDERWELTLECPNCWWSVEGVFDQRHVHELEERLDEGLSAMLSDLKGLAHTNMAEQIDRFTEALWADQIMPEDF